jgi:hypothetical protein
MKKEDKRAFYTALAKLFVTFPNRSPKGSQAEQDAIYEMWERAFCHIPVMEFDEIVNRFILETTHLFPDDNLIAMLRKKAIPEFQETSGDCIELAFEAISRFGGIYGKAGEAKAWVQSKSPLCASVIFDKVGYHEIATATNLDVIRGQITRIFNEEKERATKFGVVAGSAINFKGGLPPGRLTSTIENLSKKLIGFEA